MKKFILSILILTSTSLYAQCEGDLNGDGIKNILDIVALVNEVISGDTECEEESVHGCLDSQACNYDPTAMIDNNSCYYCYNDDCDTYPEDEYDCDGNCVDSDGDDICDNVDDCIGVVDDNTKIVGIITDGDLRRKLNSKFFDKKAHEVMTKNPTLANQNMLVAEAINIMNSKKITSLFVCENKKPIGIVHIHDLLRLTN